MSASGASPILAGCISPALTAALTEIHGGSMAGLEVMDAGASMKAGYLAPTCQAHGDARSVLFHPEQYSLWEVEAELGVDARLHWSQVHGDEVIYVLDGMLELAGHRVEKYGAAIVEAEVAAEARALTDTRVLHFGPTSPEPPAEGPFGAPRPDGHEVHIINRESAILVGDPAAQGVYYYADATCQTCRVMFFEPFATSRFVAPSHIHSEDEIIHILSGEIQVGRITLRPGMSIAVPGGTRYGFRAPIEYSFVNYRRDITTTILGPGATPSIDTAETARRRSAGIDA
jgi:uncharacterized cupin superfamily protein